jgi:predicted enzyme related to lactoylglutathione lyase
MSDEKFNVGSFCWNELITSDAEKAKEFYRSLLGWTSEDLDMGAMTYTMFKKGDKTVAGLLRIPEALKNNMHPHWLSYIYVEDLDQTVEKLKSLGGIVVLITPIQGAGRFAIIKDSTGAFIAFWQSLKS